MWNDHPSGSPRRLNLASFIFLLLLGNLQPQIVPAYGQSGSSSWYDNYDFASRGVAAYWPLDGDTVDVTGNGNNGTNQGATTANGRFGESYHFDGSSYIDLTENYAGLNEITYALWFKADSLSAYPEPIGHHGRRPFRHRGHFADHDPSVWSNRLSVSVYDLDGNPYADTVWSVSTNAWHHLAFGYGDGSLFAYLDGEKVIDEPRTGVIDWSSYMWTRIGYHSSTYEFLNWVGEVDEVVVFNRAISPEEASLLANDQDEDGIADFWVAPSVTHTPTPTPGVSTSPTPSPPGESGRVAGFILSASDFQVLPNSLLALGDDFAYTDEEGFFHFENFPMGIQQIQAVSPGYEPYIREFEVIGATPILVELSPHGTNPNADYNFDGVVDGEDIIEMKENWHREFPGHRMISPMKSGEDPRAELNKRLIEFLSNRSPID